MRAKPGELADALVAALGLPAVEALIAALGGKQIVVPDGSGRGGALTALLDEALGVAAADRFRAVFGGNYMTVPKMAAQARAARNRLIVADYGSGVSMLALVKKWDLTERQIRTILNRPDAGPAPVGRVVDERQMGLGL